MRKYRLLCTDATNCGNINQGIIYTGRNATPEDISSEFSHISHNIDKRYKLEGFRYCYEKYRFRILNNSVPNNIRLL